MIPPPVETDRFLPASRSTDRSHLLCLGRWVGYKRIDLAMRAAALADEPLTVAGSGPQGAELRRLARELQSPVTFRTNPSDAEVVELMATHRALLFPGREDFGIVPVEASAAGLPVIAYGAGGAVDTVTPGVSGLHVDEQEPDAFARAIVSSRELDFRPEELTRHAMGFTPEAFSRRIVRWLEDGAALTSR